MKHIVGDTKKKFNTKDQPRKVTQKPHFDIEYTVGYIQSTAIASILTISGGCSVTGQQKNTLLPLTSW